MWNDLPVTLRNTDLTMDTFYKHLKTVLFTDSWGRGAFVTFWYYRAVYKCPHLFTYWLTYLYVQKMSTRHHDWTSDCVSANSIACRMKTDLSPLTDLSTYVTQLPREVRERTACGWSELRKMEWARAPSECTSRHRPMQPDCRPSAAASPDVYPSCKQSAVSRVS